MLSNLSLLPTFLLATLATLPLAWAGSSAGANRVLVVLEPKLTKEKNEGGFKTFFGGLEERGYNVTFRAPKEAQPELSTDDVPNFDHIIFFSPTTKSYAKDITPQSLTTLLSKDINILFALSPATHTPLTSLAAEFGLIYPPPGTGLISHFPPGRESKDVLEIDVSSSPLFSFSFSSSAKSEGKKTGNKVLYKGASHAYTSPAPHSLFKILSAPLESFSIDADSINNDKSHLMIVDSYEKGGEGLWAGSGVGVVSGFITPGGGARVAFVGSVEMLSEKFVKAKTVDGNPTANAAFAQEIAKWVFQESCALRIKNVEHHLASEPPPSATVNASAPRETYTINDRITYTVQLETFDGEKETWVPYSIPKDDVIQLEYTMLDPHIRTNLSRVPGKPGTYTTTFRAPDRHGVFKLSLTYLRKGFTPLRHAIVTPLVPPRHDGYPRFLSSGWPFYVGAMSTSAGFVLFCALWLGGGSGVEGVRGKKKKE